MFKKEYKNLNQIHLSRQAFIHNYQYFQKTNPQTLIAPVIKSNAYGHGLTEVAQIIDRHIKPPYICVDSLYEAQLLQKQKCQTPILIIGYTFPENFKVFRKLPFTFPVFDIETLTTLNQYQPGAKVHIKIDTGMNRLGLKLEDLEDFIQAARTTTNLEFEGIYTHLAQADSQDGNDFTKQQIAIFNQAITQFRHWGYVFKWRHVAATAGASRIKSPDFNLSRLGLGFYGYSPFPKSSPSGKKQLQSLQPALSLISHLVQIKNINKGEQVSYAGTFIAPKDMNIGVLPIGYYDGLDRRLSNRGVVLIDGVTCSILGRVCMNLTMVDLSPVANPTIGQPVTVISSNPKHPNTIDQFSKLSGTISHDLLVGLNPTTKRRITT